MRSIISGETAANVHYMPQLWLDRGQQVAQRALLAARTAFQAVLLAYANYVSVHIVEYLRQRKASGQAHSGWPVRGSTQGNGGAILQHARRRVGQSTLE
jgi:hypothetical protein